MSERNKVTVTLPDEFNNPIASNTFLGLGHVEAVRTFVESNLEKIKESDQVRIFEDGCFLVTTANENGRVWLHKVKWKFQVDVLPLMVDSESEAVNPLVDWLMRAKKR